MSEEKPKLVVYSIEGNKIIRSHDQDKIHVANYDSVKGLVELLERKYRVPITRFLNDKGHKFNGYVEDTKVDDSQSSIPTKPKKNPRLGDKTPALVEWYARYNKESFIARYGVRELQELSGYNEFTEKIRNEDGKWIEIQRNEAVFEPVDHLNYDVGLLKTKQQRLIADRETTLTVKMNAADADSDSDWSLDGGGN